MKTSFIYGVHPIDEALKQQSVLELFINKQADQKNIISVVQSATKQKIPTQIVSAKELDHMVGKVSHQGIVAKIKDPKIQQFSEWIKNTELSEKTLVVLLDELTDPQNVGAIIRTAFGMGATAILMPKHNQASLGSFVWKASAGMVAKACLVEVNNVNQSIRTLKEKGFWIYGLSEKGTIDIDTAQFDTKTCVIVGNEGYGIRSKTTELCDVLLKIPIHKELDSYNASVSAGILMYEWNRQNK